MCKSYIQYGHTNFVIYFQTLLEAIEWCSKTKDLYAIYNIKYGVEYDSPTNPGPAMNLSHINE